jgi:hypothetical protein
MESVECKACPLFLRLTDNPIPEGAALAWTVYRKLTRSAVERFGMHREAWSALGLELDPETMDALIDQLSACEDGVQLALVEIEAKRRKDASKG